MPVWNGQQQPPSGGCVLKQKELNNQTGFKVAATFGWLCVETALEKKTERINSRSHLRVAVCWNTNIGDCITISSSSHLRVAVCWNPCIKVDKLIKKTQPPSGGCVLKLKKKKQHIAKSLQPPSGGCVLKLNGNSHEADHWQAATFGWLCVETLGKDKHIAILEGSHLRVAVCWNNNRE